MKVLTCTEKITACLGRHPDWEDYRIAKGIRGAKTAVVTAIRMGQPIPFHSKSSNGEAGFVSLEKIIQKYDVRTAIFKELACLPKGKLIAETELCTRSAGTDRNRFRRTVENNGEEFRPYRIKLKIDESKEGRWYWGGAEDIAEALQIRDL